MNEFRVIWEIDIFASSAEEAAEKARAVQLNPNSLATVFDVWQGETCEEIDLDKGWECESCGETAMDGGDKCISCGASMD